MDVTKLRDELMAEEGLRLNPYHDSTGYLSIGYGRCLDTAGITKEEALYLLDNDITRTCRELDRLLPWWRMLDDARARALASMAFNLGVGGLMKFSMMLAALKSGDWHTAAAEALDSKWARQVGDRATRIADIFRANRG